MKRSSPRESSPPARVRRGEGRWSLAAAAAVSCFSGGGCGDLGLRDLDNAVISCDPTSADACPSGLVCDVDTATCQNPDGADRAPPLLSAPASYDPAIAAPGQTVTATVTVSEPLGVAPTLSISDGGAGALRLAPSSGNVVDGDTTFGFTFQVSPTVRAPQLSLVLEAVDLHGNAARLLVPNGLPIDRDGPALAATDIAVAFLDDDDGVRAAKSFARSSDRLAVTVTPPAEAFTLVRADIVPFNLDDDDVEAGSLVALSLVDAGDDGDALTSGPVTLTVPEGVEAVEVRVEVRDDVGNVTAARSVPINVDRTPPLPSVERLSVDGVVFPAAARVTTSTPILRVQAGGDVQAYCVRSGNEDCDVDGEGFVAQASPTPLSLIDGRQVVTVVARDRAFLTTVLDVVLVRVEDDAPGATMTLVSPTNDGTVGPADEVAVTGTAVPGSRVSLQLLVNDVDVGAPVAGVPAVVGADGVVGALMPLGTLAPGLVDGDVIGARVEVVVDGVDAAALGVTATGSATTLTVAGGV